MCVAIEITQTLLQDGVHNPIVDARVVVDDQVPEPGHPDEIRQQLRGNDVFLAQHDEDVLVIVRCAKTLLGDDVLPDIETGLHSQLQRALNRTADEEVLAVGLRVDVL